MDSRNVDSYSTYFSTNSSIPGGVLLIVDVEILLIMILDRDGSWIQEFEERAEL